MKNAKILAFVMLLSASPALAQYLSVQGYVQRGGVPVTSGGLPPTASKFMQTFPGATVSVCVASTSCASLATIYSSSSGASKANPFTADSTTAFYQFYVAGGTYDIRFSGTGIKTPWTVGMLAVGPPSLGNGTTVIDLTTISGYTTIAATDLAQLYVDGELLCSAFQTCSLDGRGLHGTSYPWSTWGIDRALKAQFPAASIVQTVDAYQPAILIDRAPTIKGQVFLEGMGWGGSGSTQGTVFGTSTYNDAIMQMAGDSSLTLLVKDMKVIAGVQNGTDFFASAIEADEGQPNNTNDPILLDNLELNADRWAVRIATAFAPSNRLQNLRILGNMGIDLEGTLTQVDNVYIDGLGSNLQITRNWYGVPFVALHDYVLGDCMIPRDLTVGKYYCVTTAGTSGATPPTWPSSGTVVTGTATLTEEGWLPYQWLAGGFTYPANAYITNNLQRDPSGTGSIQTVWQNKGSTCASGTPYPSFNYSSAGTFTDGTCTWTQVDTFVPQNNQPGFITVNNAFFEEAPDGNCINMFNATANVTFNNVNCEAWLHDALNLSNGGGQTTLVWNGGGVISFLAAANGIEAPQINGATSGLTFNSVSFQGGQGSGYGIYSDYACYSGGTFNQSLFSNWNNNTTTPGSATNFYLNTTSCGRNFASFTFNPIYGTFPGAYSTTPVISFQLQKVWQFSCSGHGGATISPTFIDLIPGASVTVQFIQDGTTACTLDWPANVFGGMTVSSTLSSINTQTLYVSAGGGSIYATDAGLTGVTGGTP